MNSATARSQAVINRGTYWFRCGAAWRLIALHYLPLLAALNLIWEIVQLPLYTIWSGGSASEIAYAVVHCTLGDAGIGFFALAIALTLTRSGHPATWSFLKVTAITVVLAVAYTIFSEWLNVSVRNAWAYSEWMPVVPVIGTGLSPLLQWVVTPALALALALSLPQRSTPQS